ncbi:FliA/WhiG family RNA polymerase sigma factor [Bacillus sp. APMAM]|nr:FliA/WhiG family RNA polymerase sigma factor [Bacillus sp. APMAM]RTZ57787.1 FliA/WhiG family RNA polymerase sigma factor [Bacillus sp. SAJ1]
MSKAETIEEQKYWELWISSRNAQAGDVLVKKYLPLVHYHVQRIAIGLPRNVSRDDLKSFGMLGLLDALNKFDRARDLKFDTYASFRIRGAILDGLRKEDWLPRSTREKAKKIEATLEKLEQKYMRHVTAEEIAHELNMSEDDVYQTMNEQFFANVLSVDEQAHEKEDNETYSFVIKDDHIPSPEECLIHDEKIQDLTKVISTLSEKEQLVLSLFYHEELTLTEIGEIMSLTTSRISQIHSKALYKLRNILEKKM